MKLFRTLVLAAPLGVLAACGTSSTGTGAQSASPAELAAATPTIAGVGLCDTATDLTPSVFDPGPGPDDFLTQIDDDGCNPHLFIRSEEVVDRVNRHLYKALVHVEDAIAKHPALTTGQSATWTVVDDHVEATLTVSKTGADTYSWILGVGPVSMPATSVEVANGTIDTTNAAGPHQGKGTINVDLTALATVTREEVAGTLSADFESFASYKLTEVTATNVVWDTDARNPFRAAPRSASYVSYRQTGVGGSLVVQEEEAVPLSCPRDRFTMGPVTPLFASATTVDLTPATIDLVNRWYLLPASSSSTTTTGMAPMPDVMVGPATSVLHGRSDAMMAGGALSTTNVSKVEALTCHETSRTWMVPQETEWLLKAEDAAGNTLWGREFITGATPCDPALGATVPSLDNNATDFDFSGVSFTKPYLGYPGGAYPP
ncbi:MAG TPA: hypothetical protein VMK42_17720 [Anaeromyxobacteraceae bacterium]|nr:hypothetical protein [Anaeromyxobacteraceae bacterium]